jgi:hypothetical protein
MNLPENKRMESLSNNYMDAAQVPWETGSLTLWSLWTMIASNTNDAFEAILQLEHFHLRYIVDSGVTEPGLGVLWCDLG